MYHFFVESNQITPDYKNVEITANADRELFANLHSENVSYMVKIISGNLNVFIIRSNLITFHKKMIHQFFLEVIETQSP